MSPDFSIRDLRPNEFDALGRLLVEIYSNLDGFPTPEQQPRYYQLLANAGRFTEKPGTRVLGAVSPKGEVLGALVYFGDMAQYGSSGSANSVANASGIRLLGVGAAHRKTGVGKALTKACIALAQQAGRAQVILHTTQAMQTAWRLYEKLGFVRSPELLATRIAGLRLPARTELKRRGIGGTSRRSRT